MKHCHDVPTPRDSPHAHLKWAKSFHHEAIITAPKTSPWQLKKKAGTGCGLSGSANARASWSKDPVPRYGPHVVPFDNVVEHMKKVGMAPVRRGVAGAIPAGKDMGHPLTGIVPWDLMPMMSADVNNTIPRDLNPACRSFGSKAARAGMAFPIATS